MKRPTNPERSWVTAVQGDELLMDMASQCGRWVGDGTAELRGNGMFIRRETLERLGGWGELALTEDLDMSSRLAVAGERVTLAPEATVGEEAVDSPAMMWPQRMRWAEGSLRRLTEQSPALLAAPLPLHRKLDFLAWFAEFLVPPIFLASLLWAFVGTLVGFGAGTWQVPFTVLAGYGLGTFALAAAGLAADGQRGAALVGRALRAVLFLSIWLAVVPVAVVRVVLYASGRVRYVKTPRIGSDR